MKAQCMLLGLAVTSSNVAVEDRRQTASMAFNFVLICPCLQGPLPLHAPS